MTVLQYPAAYPFFSRLHVYAAQIIHHRITHERASIKIRKGVTLNDAGIYALIVSQQIGLALALALFARSCALTLKARWGTALLLASNASLFVIANLISTEALSEVIVIVFVALGLTLFRAQKLSYGWVAAYVCSLYCAIMTRHTNAIFAMLLPTAYFFRFALEWIRSRSFAAGPWKEIALFVLLGFCGIGASKLTTRILCRVFDVEYRSISARATAERLGFVDKMSPSEREEFLAGLQKRSEDPVVKEAIPALARSASWVNQRAEILKILLRQSPALDEKTLMLKSDAYLDLVAGIFYRSFNRHLIDGTIDSIRRAFIVSTASEVSLYYLDTAAYSVDLYASDPDMSRKTKFLEVCSPAAKARIIAFERNPWLRVWGWAPFGGIFIVASGGALFFLNRKVGDPAAPIFALAVSVTGVFATCLTFVLVNYIPRFAATADLFAFLALAIVVAHWIDSRRTAIAK